MQSYVLQTIYDIIYYYRAHGVGGFIKHIFSAFYNWHLLLNFIIDELEQNLERKQN